MIYFIEVFLLRALALTLIAAGIVGGVIYLVRLWVTRLLEADEIQSTMKLYRCLEKTETDDGFTFMFVDLETEEVADQNFRRNHCDWEKLCQVEPGHFIRLHLRPYTAYEQGKRFPDVMIRVRDE